MYSGLGKTYCCKHFNKVKQQHLKEEKIQKKLEEKQKKLKEKQLLKEELKAVKLSLTKQKTILTLKELKNVNDLDENVIISSNSNVIISYEKCSYIFKKGINKDKQCTCKIFENNLCKRHFV
jgi:hypothetical protein